MLLKEMLDIDELERDLADGFIRIQSHPQDEDLKVLCYTPSAQFARHWTQATRACRGIAVRMDHEQNTLGHATVLSRGIPKFFTMSDAATSGADNVMVSLEDDDEGVAQLQGVEVAMDCPVHAADKLDGAMCVGYVHEGALKLHTKGSFASDEARVANRVLTSRHDTYEMAEWLAANAPGMTPVFEVITPLYPHVVDYGSTEDLFFLGYVGISDGIWHPVREDDAFASEFGLSAPETILDGTFAEMLELPARAGMEGLVVTVFCEPQRMIKVKYDEFLRLQSLKNSATTADVRSVAANMLAICHDWNRPLAEATGPDYFPPLWARKIAEVEDDVPLRLIEPILRRGLEVARPLQARFEEDLVTVLFVWGRANAIRLEEGADANSAFVKATLELADQSARNLAFATKKTYLACSDDETNDAFDDVKHIVATSLTKNATVN